MEVDVPDIPEFSASERAKRQDRGYEPPDIGETGAALWIAAAVIILIVSGLSLFAHDGLHNGGAPFIITPSSDLSVRASPDF
jgi:hypothetical protein